MTTRRQRARPSESPARVWHSNAQADTVALAKRLPMPFALTNLDKVLYAQQQLTKADLIAYYVTVASFMLPHVKDRPLTLVRCPHGADDKCFYQKHIHAGVPDVVLRVPIAEEDAKQPSTYMAVQDLAGLIALVQMGVLEIHSWRCHRDHIEQPDQLVFDIDPDPDLAWDRSIEAALELRMRLNDVGLESFVQTTGGKGLHVVAPTLPVHGKPDWELHKNFAYAIAESMATEHPKLYLTNMRKSLRKGRIFLDYLRNGRGATAIAPYSTRARDTATVAAPITWDELVAGARPEHFTIHSMLERVSELETDPWKKYGRLKQSITAEALRSIDRG
jgi:bifunctional non-homologous end joining protein LigD